MYEIYEMITLRFDWYVQTIQSLSNPTKYFDFSSYCCVTYQLPRHIAKIFNIALIENNKTTRFRLKCNNYSGTGSPLYCTDSIPLECFDRSLFYFVSFSATMISSNSFGFFFLIFLEIYMQRYSSAFYRKWFIVFILLSIELMWRRNNYVLVWSIKTTSNKQNNCDRIRSV